LKENFSASETLGWLSCNIGKLKSDRSTKMVVGGGREERG